MFPYYLLPDAGDTQEQDEDQQPQESQSSSSFYLPYVYPGTPPELPDEDDQPTQPTVSPHDFVDPPASSDRPETTPKISIAEQIRRRNRERARQDAAAENRRRPITDIAQDIEW